MFALRWTDTAFEIDSDRNAPEFHLHIHTDTAELSTKLGALQSSVDQLTTQGNEMANTLQDVLDEEAGENTKLGQVATALQTLQQSNAALQQQLTDALSGASLPPAVQTKVDAAFAAAKANSDQVDSMLAALAPAQTSTTGDTTGTTPAPSSTDTGIPGTGTGTTTGGVPGATPTA